MHGPTRFALVAIATLLLAACGLQEGLDQRPDAGGAQASQAPAISGTTLTGQALAWSSVRGHPIVLDFWASWCGPCREALPQYDKLYGELARTDFEIVAVNLDEDVADAKKFLGAHPVRYPIALGSAGAVPKLFGLIGMPTSYLVDRNGVVRLSYQGFKPQDLDTLRTTIGKLAKETSHAQ